jgi:hypothetical protein
MELGYKEVLGYSHVSPAHRSVWLSKKEWKKLFTSKRAVAIFLSYRLVLLCAILASIFILEAFLLSLIATLVSMCFMAAIDRELVNYAHKKRSINSDDSSIRRFVSREADGWYDDPYAFGKVGQERYWGDGIWTYYTRMKLTALK